MVNMSDWTLENTPASVQKLGNTNLYASISSQRNDKGKPVYWVALKDYLGKKVSRLTMTLTSDFLFAIAFKLCQSLTAMICFTSIFHSALLMREIHIFITSSSFFLSILRASLMTSSSLAC